MHNSKFIIHNSFILGIDPGYGRLGIAVIEKTNIGDNLIHSECFETEAKIPHPERLNLVAKKLDRIFKKYNPAILAVENLLFSKNVKTALMVAEVRGVILQKGAEYGVEVREYNPNQVKLAVTGYGKSDKNQVIDMVRKILRLTKNDKKIDDEYDAIAIALTSSATILSTRNL